MIKVTLEFDGVDQAIVALSKLVGVPGSAAVRALSTPAAVAGGGNAAGVVGSNPAPGTPTIHVDKPPRKPRADRGQPRGPRQQEASAAVEAGTGGTVGSGAVSTASAGKQAEPSNAGQQAAASNSTPPALAAVSTAAPGISTEAATGAIPSAPPAPAAVATLEDFQKALEKLFTTKGEAMCHTIFAYFDVKRGRDIKPERYAEFIAKVNETLAA